jgi:hypothetical protein
MTVRPVIVIPSISGVWHGLVGSPAWVWVALWSLLLIAQTIGPLWYKAPDSCAYLSIARSLATAGHPTNLGHDHLMYGVGYPLLISAVFLADADPFLLLSLVHTGLAIFYVTGIYFWSRRYAARAALAIALVAVGNVIVLCNFRRPLSEAFFLPVMIWLVYALDVLSNSERVAWAPLAAAAVLISVLVVIRQAGILFAGGFALQLAIAAWRKQLSWQRAIGLALAVGLPGVACVGAMVAYDQQIAAQADANSNLDIFLRSAHEVTPDRAIQPFLWQFAAGIRVRISEIGRLLVPGMFNSYATNELWLDPNLIVYVPLFATLVLGYVRLVRRQVNAFAMTMPLYAAIYAYWPFNQGGRYLMPLLPLLLVCLWFALEKMGQWRVPLLRAVVAIHLGVALGYWLLVDRPRAVADELLWADVHQLADAIRLQSGRFAMDEGMGDECMMLDFVLDKHIPHRLQGQPVDEAADWLIGRVTAPIPSGFSQSEEIGPFRLMCRNILYARGRAMIH